MFVPVIKMFYSKQLPAVWSEYFYSITVQLANDLTGNVEVL